MIFGRAEAWPPRIRLPLLAAALTALIVALALAGGAGKDGVVSPEAPMFRYVNSGWVSPLEYAQASSFTQELRTFVITSQEELEAYEAKIITKRTLGNTVSLGRIDFPESVLLAAYYVWRPVQGDPLSVTALKIDGSQAVVELELSDDPQGRERPYLFAPMIMVAVERSLFPAGEPVEFVFELNGETVHTVSATPN